LTSDKCGLRVDLPIEIAARFWFVHDEDELNALPIKDEDADPLIGSRHFRLLELIEDEVILALPISARHAQCRPPQVESDETRSRSHRPFSPLAALKPRH
jgi:uncharacterized protein